MKNVEFGSFQHLEGENLNFSLLTKYLILNEATGAVRVFRFQMDPMKPETFYPRPPGDKLKFALGPEFKKLAEGVFCAGEHAFTVKYIMWYIKYVYRHMGAKRPSKPNPWKDLTCMFKFWQQGFNNQDSRVICLEIYQKYLFDQQVGLLDEDIRAMK